MAPAFPITEAQLVALFAESIAYGMHVVTFAICMYSWIHRSKASKSARSWPWMSIAIALLIVGTLDVSFNLYHNIIAFILYTGPGGPKGEFEKLSNWVNVMRSVWARLCALISDAALIYRCWVVYSVSTQRWSVVALPILIWLGVAACAVMDVFYLCTLHLYTSIPLATQMRPWLYAYFSLTLALNVVTTGMIVYPLWKTRKLTSEYFKLRSRKRDRLKGMIRIFIESALLYTLSVAVSVIMEMVQSNGYYPSTDISVQLAGFTFDLIIIRIWKGVSTEQTRAFADSMTRSPMAPHKAPWQESSDISTFEVHLETGNSATMV
ncbi:uncharacterized protein B0H18DRAFT_1042789 [Fomitopsis serialis]|uniref:uncharacterized protein n=1 Tax=Fomitopsis serialis TaxID=139415 RepID=UPI0020084FE0|nr:uncharacterized protein B0H18DRAFT_1042789 [Neoantrodia serialis]KAH9915079.1 hypothetical protein B0H18DRAFT_1042789 [Neoantrodia serialis]